MKCGGVNRLRRGEERMASRYAILAVLSGLLLAAWGAEPALAQKPGGTLKIYFFDSPASMSVHEESTIAGQGPAMGVFNNLVMYDQHVAQASMNSIVPDLATEWSWNEERTQLTFRLRQNVKWHDGKPFIAADVKCTFDLLVGTATEKLRLNPRKPWYRNLDTVITKGNDEVIFNLKRPQPAFIAMLVGIAVVLVTMRFFINMEIKVECGGEVCVMEDRS